MLLRCLLGLLPLLCDTSAITNGQRISILRVPFIVQGEAVWGSGYKSVNIRFNGVLLHQKIVLTTQLCYPKYMRVFVAVGSANAKKYVTQRYEALLMEHNQIVCLLGLKKEAFLLGPTVQKASLRYKRSRPRAKWRLYVASYGIRNRNFTRKHHPDLLNTANAFVNYDMDDSIDADQFFVLKDDEGMTKVLAEERGAPVFDMRSGEVVGLSSSQLRGTNATLAVNVGSQRDYIDAVVQKWLNATDPVPGSDD